MTRTEGTQALKIWATKHGGYIVMEDYPPYSDRTGFPIEPLFAGSLGECIDFIHNTIAKFSNRTEPTR